MPSSVNRSASATALAWLGVLNTASALRAYWAFSSSIAARFVGESLTW
jgi:hypothetical protein